MGIFETKNMPQDSYIKKVPRGKIILFTLIQAGSLAVLYVVKSTPIGISFPLFIAVLPVIRHLTEKCIDKEFCEILDPEELPKEEEERGV